MELTELIESLKAEFERVSAKVKELREQLAVEEPKLEKLQAAMNGLEGRSPRVYAPRKADGIVKRRKSNPGAKAGQKNRWYWFAVNHNDKEKAAQLKRDIKALTGKEPWPLSKK
jgi:hypothetical protein